MKKRIDFYNKAMRLRKRQGFGSYKAANILGLNIGVVGGWFYEGSSPEFNRIKFYPTKSKELAYVLGTICGDACVYKTKMQNRTAIELKSIDKDFVEAFSLSISKIFNKTIPNKLIHTYDGYWRVIYGSRLFFNFFELLNLEKIRKTVSGYESSFLRALFDSEGSVNVEAKVKLDIGIALANTDRALLNLCKYLLEDKFSIKSCLVLVKKKGSLIKGAGNEIYKRNRDVWRLWIRDKRNIETFRKSIGFSIARKQTKLEDALRIKESYPDRKEAAQAWKDCYKIVGRQWLKTVT